MKQYRLITSRLINLADLNFTERTFLWKVLHFYVRKRPEWTKFSNWWLQEAARYGISSDSKTLRVCDDLEARLGIKQGKVLVPDYRYSISDLIEEKYGSRYNFCKESGVDQGQLSRVISGKQGFSIKLLEKILKFLGARLVIATNDELAKNLSPEKAQDNLSQSLHR